MKLGNIKKVIVSILSITTVLSFSGCDLVEKTPEAKEKTVVAKVNKEKITKGEFDKKYNMQVGQIEAMYGVKVSENAQMKDYVEKMKPQILDNMITETVALQKANELKVVPEDKELNEEIDKKYKETETKLGGTEKFNEFLKSMNVASDYYKGMIKNSIIFDKLYAKVTSDVVITDTDISNYYHTNIYDFTEKPNKMTVSHILCETEDEAKKVADEINKGMKFEDAAKKYSKDPSVAQNNGNLGEVYYSNKANPNKYDQDFLNGAINAELNKVTKPIKSSYGFHLILVTKRETYPAKPIESVKNDIKTELTQTKKDEKFQSQLKEWKDKSKITRYEDRLK
ncbi:MAG TPA: peptidylprolyl isomerase [Clostridiaceae bacterium]|jgi:foldase protein PrsA|nr:peptidylprolyl isomerase [Clostridiaceae bacterium]HBF76397.1 peptidylprolyl isomerase [Clostridiaceae bacterium]HBG38460.1 peptidylprolyl isomerase [Clostridiaceae bacterium]HBN28844.1 peptidylprolyl isomerase [Clostridiaceae bacterium]HBX47446.1 peptidylprolyl isomerase [Clostridiaceae bacterium]